MSNSTVPFRPSAALEMQLALGGYFLSPDGQQTIARLTGRGGAPAAATLEALLLQTLLRSPAFYSSPAACAWTIQAAPQHLPAPVTTPQLPALAGQPALHGFCWLGRPLHLPVPSPAAAPLGDILAITWSVTSWAARPPAPEPALLIGAFPRVAPQPPSLLPIGPPLVLCEWPLQRDWTAARDPFAALDPDPPDVSTWRRELVLRYISALWRGLHTQTLQITIRQADPAARTRLAPLHSLINSHLGRELEVQVITTPCEEVIAPC